MITKIKINGFKSFHDIWDEGYDGHEGLHRYVKILELIDTLANKSVAELEDMYTEMKPILEHNYQRFADGSLVRDEWQHLTNSLSAMCKFYEFKPPYRLNRRLGQAIPVDPT